MYVYEKQKKLNENGKLGLKRKREEENATLLLQKLISIIMKGSDEERILTTAKFNFTRYRISTSENQKNAYVMVISMLESIDNINPYVYGSCTDNSTLQMDLNNAISITMKFGNYGYFSP